MPFDFTIRIIGKAGQAAQFVPQGGNVGSSLTVNVNDTVSWGNDTDEEHHPVADPPPPPLLSNPIPPRQASSPAWVAAVPAGTVRPATIRYRCATHPDRDEVGTIIVT
jgi:hypothetical protein